ncbi:hypothetical protein JL720_15847 [Aureococcus anophagefferens]|nr:hypothetical protein JL720_15847 [Aureococcus anophagefferens]
MTSVAARAATQDELAFLSEFLEPTTGDDSSDESDAELDCSAPAPRSPPPSRGGGVAMRQVTRAELRYVLDDAAAPEPERVVRRGRELSDDDDGGGDGPALAASCCRLAAPRRWLAAVALALGVSAAAPPEPPVDAAPRARGWSGGCGRAQSLGGNNPWGPIVDIWARNAWAAWSRGATFVPPSLRGWYLAAPADDAFCAGAASQWACHFLPLSACDEIAESGEDDDARRPRLPAATSRSAAAAATTRRSGPRASRGRRTRGSRRSSPRPAAPSTASRPDPSAPCSSGASRCGRATACGNSRDRRPSKDPASSRRSATDQRRRPSGSRHKTASFFVDLADYAREARALAPPGQAFTLFVATDDADALRDATRLDAEDLRRRRGAIVIRRRVERGLWTGGRATSMHRGPAELARILATLEAAAAACGGFVGNCASVFVRRVDAAPSLRLAPIANVARGGASSAYFRAGADALFRRPADLLPKGTSTPPLANDVDLVLLAFTANDFALGCAEPATCFGAAARAGRLLPPGAGAPAVAFVDTALQRVSRTPENLTRADFSERHRARARQRRRSSSMFWSGGAPDEAEQRRAAAFLNAYLAPALRVALDAMMGPASWKGFGHYGAAYHEARRRRRLRRAEPRGAVGSPDGWLHGEDVPGKSGWVACDGGGAAISFRVECAAGDVVVGFLQSHDRRMGVANVTVAQGAAVRSFLVASWDRRPRSVYATKALTGLAAGETVVSLRVLDRNQHAGPAFCPRSSPRRLRHRAPPASLRAPA